MRIAARSLAGLAAGPLLILLAQPGPASGQAPCMPGSTVSVVAVSADGTVSRGTLFWAQAPAGARLAAAVTVFDSTDAMIHGIRAAWQEDGVSPAGALVRLDLEGDEGETIEAEVPRETWEALGARSGERLFVSPRAVRLFVE